MSDLSFGVLYFVDENPSFRAMAEMSLQSLRRFHPDVPVECVEVPSASVSPLRQLYRTVSFWKRKGRRRRLGQDTRVIAEKARIMVESPFETTLYLDADTIVLRSLDSLIARAKQHDVVITELPWKRFERQHDWQPESWPFLMAGIMFYSRRFRDLYAEYVERVGEALYSLPLTDMNLLSMVCHCEHQQLDIAFEPTLQLDHCNLSELLGHSDWQRYDEHCIDLHDPAIRDFAIFHYNDYKPTYMQQIAECWGYSPDRQSEEQHSAALL